MEVTASGYAIGHLPHSQPPPTHMFDNFRQHDYKRVASPARSEGGHRAVTLDEMHRKLSRVKKELELERARNQQYSSERERSTRHMKDMYEREWTRRLEKVESKMRDEMDKKIAAIKNSVAEEKDVELRQVLRYKEEEAKSLQSSFTQEKEDAIRVALELQKIALSRDNSISYDHDDSMVDSLKSELESLKSTNKHLKDKYQQKCDEEDKKEAEIKRIKEKHDIELSRVMQESKIAVLQDLHEKKIKEKLLRKSNSSSLELPLVGKTIKSEDKSVKSAFKLTRQEQENIESALVHAKSTSSNRTFTVDDSSDTESAKRPNSSKSLRGYRPVIDDDEEIEHLQAEVQRLEKKLSVLKTENDTLKKKQEDQKPLEEKIRSLKRRNAELAAMARRLEEKAKHLQQENLKKPKDLHHNEVDHMKRMFARQRARDLAEYAKNMLARDKEIEELRKKCQELAEQLGNQAIAVPENIQVYQEKEELENIIKQSAKERLLLERQVIRTKPDKVSEELQESRNQIHSLEELNQGLEDDIVTLRHQLHSHKDTKEQLEKRISDCENLNIQIDGLSHNLKTEQVKVRDLEEELQSESTKNTELTSQVSELQERLKEVEKYEEDVQSLQKSLAESQYECNSAKEQATELQQTVQRLESECTAARDEATELQSEVDKLESLLKHLRECAEQHEELEREHEEARSQLQKKQEEVTMLQKTQSDWKRQTEAELTESQDKLARLTAELDVLSLELEKNKTRHSSNSSIAIQTDHDDESSVFLSNGHQHSDSLGNLSDDLIRSKSARLAESAKSLDTGFSEGEEDDLHSPLKEEFIEGISRLPLTPETHHSESTAGLADLPDPELSAISQRLRELEASQSPSEEDFTLALSEGDQSSFMSAFHNKSPQKMENGLITPNSRLLGRKGPLQVYVAKYSYDPYHYSPNDNPDAELPLNAGDYILIHGEMDEDGFFEGELIDGRRGLVPSNFIEKVADEDLQEFHNTLALAHSDDGSYGNSLQQDLDFNSSDESEKVVHDVKPPETTVVVKEEKPNIEDSMSLSITDNSLSDNKPDLSSKNIPCPVKLKLDRQLTSSVVVSWLPPEGLKVLDIQAYHVYLDGEFQTSVRGTERTKALVENVDTSKIHRISVRTVTSQGWSCDAQCTMLVGKDAIPAPSKLELTEISANSAMLSWLPGNSSYHHVICVNGQEVRIIKPNVCSHLLSGLASGSKLRVSVQAKNLSSTVEASKRQQELLTSSVEFTTLAGGVPDPPLDVQLEAGPQEGTLLLTWLPVTITPAGTSNGTVVTGYAVYADGKQLRQVTCPTNDHAVLSGPDFHGIIPKVLTIRTLAGDQSESVDSNPVKVQHGLVKELSRGGAKGTASTTTGKHSHAKQPKEIDPHDTDEEIEQAFKAGENQQQPAVNAEYGEEGMETSSSELSDIQEVEEENLSESQDTEHSLHRASPRGDKKNSSKHSRHNEDKDKSSKAHDSSQQASRVVPHIQIIRDSSSEQGTSFEVAEEDDGTKRLSQQQRSAINQRVSPDEPRPRKPSPSPAHSVESEGYPDVPKGRRPTSGKSESSDTPRRSPVNKHGHTSNHDTSDSLNQSEDSVQELTSNDVMTKKTIRDDIPESELIDYEDNGEGDSMAEAGSDIYDDKLVRLFIALFDYDPVAMSPNVDSMDEELPFKEGQLIKVYGDKDADGFYRGSCNNRTGYVPCNMVSEVQVDDPEIAAQLLHESQNSLSTDTFDEGQDRQKTPTHESSLNRLSPGRSPSIPQELNVRKMVALYDYDPQELSPNVDAEVELSFKAGDIIVIFGEMDEDGFFQGESNGMRGLVPSNFLTPVSPGEDEVIDSASVVSPCRSGDSLDNNTTTATNESDWPQKVGHSQVPLTQCVVGMFGAASPSSLVHGNSDDYDDDSLDSECGEEFEDSIEDGSGTTPRYS